MKAEGKKKLDLNVLEEIRQDAYKNVVLFKIKTKF